MVTAVNIPQHHEDAAARSMLIGVVLLFAGVLMAGWYLLIAPSLLNNMSFLALPLSIGVGVFAVVIARGVASELLRVRANPEALNRHTWKMWLVLLFLLSALGTLNAGIYFGEGPAVLTESLSTALQDFQILQAQSVPMLATPAFDARKKDVDALMSLIAEEVTHSGNCGVGRVTQEHIDRLKSLLPGFSELSGHPNCHTQEGREALASMMNNYRDQVARLLKKTDEYKHDNVEKIEEFQTRLASALATQLPQLENARAALQPSGATSGLAHGDDPRTVASDALEAAADVYHGLLQELMGLRPPGSAMPVSDAPAGVPGMRNANFDRIPAAIPTAAALQIGHISQVLPFVLGRLGKPTTYVYVTLALLFDLLVVACFKRVLPVPGTTPSRTTSPVVDEDLTYLWVNP